MARDAYEAGCIGQGRYPVIIKSLQLIKTRGFDVKEAEQTKPSRRAVQLHIRPSQVRVICDGNIYSRVQNTPIQSKHVQISINNMTAATLLIQGPIVSDHSNSTHSCQRPQECLWSSRRVTNQIGSAIPVARDTLLLTHFWMFLSNTCMWQILYYFYPQGYQPVATIGPIANL